MADETAKDVAPVNGADVLRVMLTKPVMAHGDEIKELVFREPTGGDIALCGCPVTIHMLGQAEPRVIYDSQAMEAMMSRLSAVPPSTIKNLAAADWMAGCYLLSRFFMPS